MTRKIKLKTSSDLVEQQYQNWLAQMLSIMMPRVLYLIAGRGSAKTVQILCYRLMQAMIDCPGAPFAWVADTYADLHKNVIVSVLEGLNFLGMREGFDYVIDKEPPQEWKNRMYTVFTSYKNTMVFYTGFSLTFISLDKASIGAGRSYVGIFGDEVKYFSEEKITNLLKAVRGYRAKYGKSPWYLSRTFTTDMPNPNHIGEYNWILRLAKQNNKEKILLALRAGFVVNDVKKNYGSKLQQFLEAQEHKGSITDLKHKVDLLKRTMDRWIERWNITRDISFFWICSSYVNVDILGMEWFDNEVKENLEGLQCNVLSIIPKLEAGQRFYANLCENNFYADGYKTNVIEEKPFGWEETCECLNHYNPSIPLDSGMDAGNMLSMVFGQRSGMQYHIFKELYTLPPETVKELGTKFISYFKGHKRKVLKLYYDRSMNSYKKVRDDMATKIKKAIEYTEDGKRTGWIVQLMSIGQGDISSNTEYNFFSDLLSGNLKYKLFELKIDRHNCACLKSEMEVTKTRVSSNDQSKRMITKEKSGDKLPAIRLPKESTNLTDALKYLIMRRAWMSVWNSKHTIASMQDPK